MFFPLLRPNAPSGMIFNVTSIGQVGRFRTFDDTPAEFVRTPIGENIADVHTYQIVAARVSDFTVSVVQPTAFLTREPGGTTALTFAFVGLIDPFGLGVTATLSVDGNDFVVEVVGLAGTEIAWGSQTTRLRVNPVRVP